MASMAEMMFQSASQSVGQAPDIGGSIAKGAQLGAQIEQTQQQRQRLEMAKQEQLMNKINSVTDSFELAGKVTDPKLRNFLLKNVVPGKIKALGLEQYFSPQSLEMIQQSPEALDKFRGLKIDLESRVTAGEITASEAYQEAARVMQDPEALAMLDTDRLIKAQQFSTAEYGKTQRVERQGQIGLGKQMQAQAAAPTVEAGKGIAKEFADYQAAGGKATLDKNLGQLEEAAKKLESGEVKTGKISAAVPGLASDMAQDVLNPEIAAVRDQVRGAVQATLRQTLGAQFTAQEGEAIFNRSFNPRLSADENAKRIRTVIQELKQNIANKEKAFKAQGFAVSPSFKIRGKEISADKLRAAPLNVLEKAAKEMNITVEELKQKLGM